MTAFFFVKQKTTEGHILASIRQKGKLKKWFDDKGYGFILPDKGSKDVFIQLIRPQDYEDGQGARFEVYFDNNKPYHDQNTSIYLGGS